jgi:hypothetical protein
MRKNCELKHNMEKEKKKTEIQKKHSMSKIDVSI